MKQAWERIGTPDAISWVVVFLLSVQQVSGSLTAPFADISGRVSEFLFLRITSLLVMFAVLGFGKLLLLRFAQTKPKPLLTLAVFLCTVFAGTVSINGLLILAEFTDEWNLGRRLIVAIPGSFTILILSALLVTYTRELARRNQEIALSATELEQIRNDSSQRLQDRKDKIINDVQHQLESALFTNSEGSMPKTTDNLKSLIDDVVRPMSYQLSREVSPYTPEEKKIISPRVSWSEVLTIAMKNNPAHPIASTLWVGALVGMFLITGFGALGLLATLALCAISFLVLSIPRMFWKYLPIKIRTLPRVFIFSFFIITMAAILAPTMEAITGYRFTLVHAYIGWLILAFFMTWTVTIIFAVNDNLSSTFTQLSHTVEELKRETIYLKNELRSMQKGMSRILHGPIQEAISASIHKIQTHKQKSQQNKAVEDLNQRIKVLLSSLNETTHIRINFEQALNELTELWDEVALINIDTSSQTLQEIQKDPYCESALLELIREGCNNAIRHGEAKNIDVSIGVSPHKDQIFLIMTNDGKPLQPHHKSGLGSQIFDECCLSWKREQVGPLVRVEASIPLSVSIQI